MTSFLRSIAVTVDEPDPGSFYWVLLEARLQREPYQVLQMSPRSYPSFDAAILAGVDELRRMSQGDGPESGPRTAVECTDENPSGWTPLM